MLQILGVHVGVAVIAADATVRGQLPANSHARQRIQLRDEGFGLIDAQAAVARATGWTNVGPQVAGYDSGAQAVGMPFADNERRILMRLNQGCGTRKFPISVGGMAAESLKF